VQLSSIGLPPGATVTVIAGTFILPSGLSVTVTGIPGTWTVAGDGTVTVDTPDVKFFTINASRPGKADKQLIISTDTCSVFADLGPGG
jgi:hypothetical protein